MRNKEKHFKVLEILYAPLFLAVFSFLQAFFLLNTDELFSTKLLYTFSSFLFYFILSQISKVLLKTFLIFSFLICVLLHPLYQIYGELDFNFVSALYFSNPSESISYLKVIPIISYFKLFFLLIILIFLLKSKFHRIKSKYLVPVCFVILISFPIKKLISYTFEVKNIHNYFNVLPIKKTVQFIYLSGLVKKEIDYIKTESKKSHSWDIDKIEEKELYNYFVIIIGESARKDFMQSYGFPYPNTPFLEESKRIQFQNYYSISPQTIPSLSRTIALSADYPKYELNNNIVNLAKLMGYETYWFSNQGELGVNESPVSVIAKNSDFSHFLNKGEATTASSDELLIEPFERVINQKKNKPKFIVLHLYGSHPYSCDRTEGKYDKYIASKDISCYIKSLENTDKLLKEIYQSLNSKSDKSFQMVYFSDHGLIINDDLSFSHGKGLKQNYEVPLVIWGSDIDSTNYINSNRTGNDFLLLFAELNGFKLNNLKSDYKFLSEDENSEKGQIKVLNSDEVIVNYDILKKNDYQNYLKKDALR